MKSWSSFAVVLLFSAYQVAATVTGTVVRSDGTPVAHARVTILRPIASTDWEETLLATSQKPLATVVTDAKGIFAVSVEGLGLVRLRVDADGFAPLELIVEMKEDAGLIPLRAAPFVEGHVTAGGRPVAGAEVFVAGGGVAPSRYTTDANGIYRVPDPRQWAKAIVVLHRDYVPAMHPSQTRDFVLTKGRAIAGRVIDANNKPVGGVRVSLSSMTVTTSATDGTFRFPHAPSGAGIVTARNDDGVGRAEVADDGVTVKLLPLRKISGVVRDAFKHPLSNVEVMAASMQTRDATVTNSDGSFKLSMLPDKYILYAVDGVYDFRSEADTTDGDVHVEAVATNLPAVDGIVNTLGGTIPSASVLLLCRTSAGEQVCGRHVLTDEQGRFHVRIPVFPGMTVRALVTKPGRSYILSGNLDSSTGNVVITIPPGDPVSGRVVDSSGHPISGVLVTTVPIVDEGASLGPWATTDDDGRFSGQEHPGSAHLLPPLPSPAQSRCRTPASRICRQRTVQVFQSWLPFAVSVRPGGRAFPRSRFAGASSSWSPKPR